MYLAIDSLKLGFMIRGWNRYMVMAMSIFATRRKELLRWAGDHIDVTHAFVFHGTGKIQAADHPIRRIQFSHLLHLSLSEFRSQHCSLDVMVLFAGFDY